MFRQPVRISLSDHHSMFVSAFTTLLDNGVLVDVTLAAEGRSIRAHKVVLSACSSYFKSLFIENPCKHPIVILKDVQYADLTLVVDFMYQGEIEIPEQQATQFLEIVKMLGIKSLYSTPLNVSKIQSSGQAVSLAPKIEPMPVESVRTSTGPTSEEQNSNEWSSDKITAQKSILKTLTLQHNQVNPKMPGMSQKTPVVFRYPYHPIDVRPNVSWHQPQPVQPPSSRQSNLGGMSSGGNQKDRSQSPSPRKKGENIVQQPVCSEHSEGPTLKKYKQQMIKSKAARKISFSDSDHHMYKMIETPLIKSRLESLLISRQNLIASATATSTDINNTSEESSDRLSQSNIPVPPDNNGVFDANKNC